tara:strand:- start:155 stop:742 length:588 start_codon:yes stop_codon:yes gene_type:complete
MQKKLPKIYLFVEDFNPKELDLLNKNISIIYRNYKKKIAESTIISLKKYCKSNKRDLYLAKDIKLAIKFKLSGVYIPSFINKLNFNSFLTPKNFLILGSAHNAAEIRIKQLQGCNLIFLAPTFRVLKKKNYLGIIKFNLLTLGGGNFVALGGINQSNFKQINLLKCSGFAGISWIKKNGPRMNLGRLNCLNISIN